MDEWIDRLEKLTAYMADRADQAGYEELSEFVDVREKYVQQLKAVNFSKSEWAKHKDAVQRILRDDTIITARMKQLRDEAGQALNKADQGKKLRSGYDADYGYGSESMFYDRKR